MIAMLMTLKFVFVLIGLRFGTDAMADDEVRDNVLSERDRMRLEYKYNVPAMIGISHADYCLAPLTPEQRANLQLTVDEFVNCLNITIDALFDNVDANLKYEDIRNLRNARMYVPQMCTFVGDALKCYRNFAPTFELCLNETEKSISKNLITIASWGINSVCRHNGTTLVELLEYERGLSCSEEFIEILRNNDNYELFFKKSTRDMVTDCTNYKHLENLATNRFGNCSLEAFQLSRPMFVDFCEATRCRESVNDIICD